VGSKVPEMGLPVRLGAHHNGTVPVAGQGAHHVCTQSRHCKARLRHSPHVEEGVALGAAGRAVLIVVYSHRLNHPAQQGSGACGWGLLTLLNEAVLDP